MNAAQIWKIVSGLPQFKNRRLSDYRFMAIGQDFSLTTGQVSATTRVDFAGGAIIGRITAGLSVSAAATSQIRDLSGFELSIDFPNNESIVTGGRMNAAALFGAMGEVWFPLKPIIVPTNGSINYVLENLTTSTINVSIVHHCLVSRSAK